MTASNQQGPGSSTPVSQGARGPFSFLKRILYPGWLRHLITERDNQTIDGKRLVGYALVIGFFQLAEHSVVINHSPFDPNAYALGAAALMAGFGGMLTLGASSERPIGQ